MPWVQEELLAERIPLLHIECLSGNVDGRHLVKWGFPLRPLRREATVPRVAKVGTPTHAAARP